MGGIPYNVWLRDLRAGLSWFRNGESNQLPDDCRLLPKRVGANMQNKGVVQPVHIFGLF
jgi:hypothetical protein